MWTTRPTFLDTVRLNWNQPCEGNPQYIIAHKLSRLKTCLKAWNKETFGHNRANIASAEKTLLLAQQDYDTIACDQLLAKPNLAKSSFHNWIRAEEILWQRKSKLNWLLEGDKNTIFPYFGQSEKKLQQN